MYFYCLLLGLLFGNFFSFLGMNKELVIHHASQDLFDRVVYPTATPAQMLNFERAKRKIKTHPEQAEHNLILLATDKENPHVPSMRQLVNVAAQKRDFNSMAVWATRAVDQPNADPECAATLAGLLASDQEIALFNSLEPMEREQTIHQLLSYAATPKNISQTADSMYVYKNSKAEELLRDFQAKLPGRLQEIHEKQLQQLSKNERERLQFDTLKEKSLPNACFFIKDLLGQYQESRKDWIDEKKLMWSNVLYASPHAQRALQWAIFAAGERAGAQCLIDSGACDELRALSETTEDDDLKAQIKNFLKQIDDNGSDITTEEQNKAEEKLLEVSAESDLRALVALAQRKDSSLVYITELINRLPEALEQEYPRLLKDALQILKTDLAAGNQERNHKVSELVARLIGSRHYQSYMQSIQPNSASYYDIGNLIYDGSTHIIEKQSRKKIRECARGILQTARSHGNLHAHWKLLAVSDATQIFDDFTSASEATLKITKKDDETLVPLIAQALANLEKNPGEQMCGLLGGVYVTGMGDWVALDEEKGVQYLMRGGQRGLTDLLHFAPLVTNARAALKAAQHLISHGSSLDEQELAKALAAYYKTLKSGDCALKKEALNFLKIQEGADYFFAELARQFCADLGDNEQNWQREQDYVNALIDTLVVRSATNQQAKIILNEMLANYSDLINHPKITDPSACAQEGYYELALQGDLGALMALMPFYMKIKITIPELTKAAHYWYAFWRRTRLHSERLKTQSVEAMRLVANQYNELLTDVNTAYKDLAYNYHTMMVLAETEPGNAMRLLHHAEMACLQRHYEPSDRVLKASDAQDFIDEQVAQKKGWGYFAKALVILFRGPLREQNHDQQEKNIKVLEEASVLLRNAERAELPFVNVKMLSFGMIDYWMGIQYDNWATRAAANSQKKDAKDARKLALSCYDRGAQKGCAAAAFSWAQEVLLVNHEHRGQEVFEKAVSRLIQALEDDDAPSRKLLQEILRKGYAQVWCCGGNITPALHATIEAALQKDRQAHPTAPEVGAPVSAPAHAPVPSTLSCAIEFLNSQRYQDAFDLFNAEAGVHANPIANIYLGIMQRQGVMGEPNHAEGLRLFKKGLLGWDGSHTSYGDVLTAAFSEVKEHRAYDMEAAHASLHYALHIYHESQSPTSLKMIFDCLEKMELLAIASSNPADKSFIFTSGIARRLSVLYNHFNDVNILMDLVSLYAKRIHDIGAPDAKNQQESFLELLVPFNDLSAVLVTQILEDKSCSFFKNFTPENAQVFFKNLESTVTRSRIHPNIPLERVIGLLYLSKATESLNGDQDNKKGLAWLQRAVDHNDQEAKLVLGYLKICGTKYARGLPSEPKRGLLMLRDLAERGYTKASNLLAHYYYEKKEYKIAESYVKQVLDSDRATGAASLLAAKIYYEIPSLLPDAVKDKGQYLFNLCTSAYTNDVSLTISGHLFQLLLAVTKFPAVFSVEEISERLRAMLLGDRSETLFTEVALSAKNHLLHERLLKWADGQLANVATEQRAFFIPIYSFLGWLNTLIGNNRKLKGETGEKEYATAAYCLESAAAIKGGKSLLPHCFLLRLALEKDTPLAARLEEAQKHFENARTIAKSGNFEPEEIKYFNEISRAYLTKVMEHKKSSKK